MDAVLQRVDGAGGVLAVVGTDADCVQLLGLQHGMAALIAAHALQPVGLAELLGLAGNQIRSGHQVYVGHLLIAFGVLLGDPAGANDADFYPFRSVDFWFFIINIRKTV